MGYKHSMYCYGRRCNVFNSASKPWKIPLIVLKDDKTIINVLIKSEDEKDKLTMIVQMLQSMWILSI